MRNVKFVDTQTSIEWPYCSFPILCLDFKYLFASDEVTAGYLPEIIRTTILHPTLMFLE